MTSALFLASGPGEIRAALVEEGLVAELHVFRENKPSLLGAIFLARVMRAVPAMPGAFLDLDGAVTGFLPGAHGAEASLPPEGSALVVQVVKEAHANKPPEVTKSLSIQGKYLVWTPSRPGIAVSRHIAPTDRARLSALLKELIRDDEGAIVRTHGIEASRAALLLDVEAGRVEYTGLIKRAAALRPPVRLDFPASPSAKLLSNFAGLPISEIIVDDLDLVPQIRGASPSAIVAKDDKRFIDVGFEDCFAAALSRSVTIGALGTANIMIDAVEACTLIDVNLGSSAARGHASNSIADINRAAAIEIARQLRLRNISGAIIIDFISMRSKAHRVMVETALREATAQDPTLVEFHGWTRLGHFELTRQRRSPSLAEILLESPRDPHKTPTTVAHEVLRAIARGSFAPGPLEVRLNPKVAQLLKGAFAPLFKKAALSGGHFFDLKSDAGRDIETFEIAPSASSKPHE